MEAADTDRLVVLDRGTFVGMVTTGDILKLDAIVHRAEQPTSAFIEVGLSRSGSGNLAPCSPCLIVLLILFLLGGIGYGRSRRI